MNNSNTNYMRSVNDYSLSAHEIFNEATANRFPADTRVYTAKNISADNFLEASEIVLENFISNGYKVNKHYSINYEDGSNPGEESQYTIYEQQFYVLTKTHTNSPNNLMQDVIDDFNKSIIDLGAICPLSNHDPSTTIVLEMYRRNNELIVLTLSPISTKEYLLQIAEKFRDRYKPEKKEKVFYTISATSHGFELEEMNIPTVYDESHFQSHYNDSFLPVHETIISTIDSNKKGLILLHGLPGTGKTSYIKQLISKGGSRKLVYIPPHLASSIASPQFISFVREKLKNSVLIIEEAEQILHDREGGGDSAAVANLLNISDGILGEALNILIIATFNIPKEFIDKALLRKGRLICEYYFDELELNKSEQLVKIIHGDNAELVLGENEQRTLGNIFNMDVVQHRSNGKPKVAFGFHNR